MRVRSTTSSGQRRRAWAMGKLAHAEAPGLVAARGHDTSAVGAASHGYGAAAKAGIVAHLHRRKLSQSMWMIFRCCPSLIFDSWRAKKVADVKKIAR